MKHPDRATLLFFLQTFYGLLFENIIRSESNNYNKKFSISIIFCMRYQNQPILITFFKKSTFGSTNDHKKCSESKILFRKTSAIIIRCMSHPYQATLSCYLENYWFFGHMYDI